MIALRGFRWYTVVYLLLVAALAGCLNVSQGRTVDDDLMDYEKTLREEAGWLWENMNYANTHLNPDAEHCRVENFEHKPVSATDSLRDTDGTAAQLADQLNYAKLMMDEARGQWFKFCRGEATAAQTAPYMEARLRPTYTSLNSAQTILTERAAAAAKGK